MRFVTYQLGAETGYGILRGDDIINLNKRLGAEAPTLKALIATGRAQALAEQFAGAPADCKLSQVKLLPVIPDPALIACIGLNYEEHRIETGFEASGNPPVFFRYPSSLQGAEQPLVIPRESASMDYEAELAIIIGKGGRRIARENAWDHVFGVTCFNDGSVRDWQNHTTQFGPGKNFPFTGPLGPSLVTLDELPADRVLTLTTRVGDEVLQHATTEHMIFPIPRLIAYVSTFLPLQPGDIIATGTPGGVGYTRKPPRWLRNGETVEIDISSVGVLRNPIIKEA